jgi:excisionase family DNA binding protein
MKNSTTNGMEKLLPEPAWLSMKDIAQILSCSYRTVQRLVQSGELRHTMVGRMPRITEEDLKEFKEKNRVSRKNNGNEKGV